MCLFLAGSRASFEVRRRCPLLGDAGVLWRCHVRPSAQLSGQDRKSGLVRAAPAHGGAGHRADARYVLFASRMDAPTVLSGAEKLPFCSWLGSCFSTCLSGWPGSPDPTAESLWPERRPPDSGRTVLPATWARVCLLHRWGQGPCMCPSFQVTQGLALVWSP